jgi:hypothetical protein
MELIIEMDFLKSQVNGYNVTLVSMEGERKELKTNFARNEEKLEVLPTKLDVRNL